MTTPRGVAVPPWIWMVAIRDTCPLDRTAKLVLLMVRAFMGEGNPAAYPSQRLLANACSLTENAVQAALRRANAAGWVAVYEHQGTGQRWKNYVYRSCVPVETARLLIQNEKHAALIDAWHSSDGDVDGGFDLVQDAKLPKRVGDVRRAKVPNPVGDVRPPSRAEAQPLPAFGLEAPQRGDPKVPNGEGEGPQRRGEKLPNAVGTKSSLKVLSESQLQKGRLAPTARMQDTSQERKERIRKAIQSFPTDPDDVIARMTQTLDKEVRQERAQLRGTA